MSHFLLFSLSLLTMLTPARLGLLLRYGPERGGSRSRPFFGIRARDTSYGVASTTSRPTSVIVAASTVTDRFPPYHGAALNEQIEQACAAFPRRIIDHLPEQLGYLGYHPDKTRRQPRHRPSRIILGGGEALHPAIRDVITYPAVEAAVGALSRPGVRLIVQTTGDLLSSEIIAELVARGIHDLGGGPRFVPRRYRYASRPRPTAWTTGRSFTQHGLRPSGRMANEGARGSKDGPTYSFLAPRLNRGSARSGPRGRAFAEWPVARHAGRQLLLGLVGGAVFLDYRYDGSEVSIDPGGRRHPCLKTRRALGNLVEEPLLDILQSLVDDRSSRPSTQYPAAGDGRTAWSQRVRSSRPLPHPDAGRLPYQNLCIGCDRLFEDQLGHDLPGCGCASQRRQVLPVRSPRTRPTQPVFPLQASAMASPLHLPPSRSEPARPQRGRPAQLLRVGRSRSAALLFHHIHALPPVPIRRWLM